MVEVYRTSCNHCKSFFELKYGRKNKDEVYEIFCCPKCKDLFSLSNMQKNKQCPNCGNDQLKSYNMNKEKNIRYYKKMMSEHLLSPKEYNRLVSYWKNVESTHCPKCDHDGLTWRLYEKR